MTTDGYFRISIIDGALELLKHQQRYNVHEREDAIRQLRLGPSHLAHLDYDAAVEFAEIVGWNAFQPALDRPTELRQTLMSLVQGTQPLWAQASLYGRERVKRVVGEDQAQCLRFAGLLDELPSEEAVEWWDKVANFFRSLQDERNLDKGREGEQLTLAYERHRLANLSIEQQPVWTAIEDNVAGYDILSYDKDQMGETHELKIEVKATTSSQPSFIISRTEWEVAQKYASWYKFYIWQLEERQLTIMQVDEVAQHIPSDVGSGRWLQIKVVVYREE